VIASWAGHSVFIVSGFVMPRLLDRYLGQQALGVWDICWSIVGYFSLVQMGIGSSVNRFVARNRAERSADELSRTVSSALALQATLAVVVLIAAGLMCWWVPALFPASATEADTERWVLLLLGASVAIQMATDTFRGVITGCHRWGLHNGLNSGFYALSVVGMIAVLKAGGTLVGVAAVYASGVLVLELARVVAAHRACPELRVSPRAITVERIRQLVGFGSKSALDDVSTLVLNQTNAVAIAATLGPTAPR
jgi:O-antigen/teichoic acid export membrane protein